MPDKCTAYICHGPGHQSSTMCELTGIHEVHQAHYGRHRQLARWRDGSYTDRLRALDIKFDAKSYPENIVMSGFLTSRLRKTIDAQTSKVDITIREEQS